MAEQIYPLLPILLLYNRATPHCTTKQTTRQSPCTTGQAFQTTGQSCHTMYINIAIHTHIYKLYVHTHTMSISCFGGGRVAVSLPLALSSRVLSAEENTKNVHTYLHFCNLFHMNNFHTITYIQILYICTICTMLHLLFPMAIV